MAKIDPNDPTYDSQPRFQPRDGRKVCAITRYHRDKRRDGVATIYCGLVVIKDLEPPDPKLDPPSDEGLSTRMRFNLDEFGTRWVARAAKALGHTAPFDPEVDADLDAVVDANKGILIGTVKTDTYVGQDGKERTTTELQKYEPASLVDLGLATLLNGKAVLTDEVLALIAKGEADYDEMRRRQAERAAHPQGRRGGGGGGGARREVQYDADGNEVPF